MVKQRSLGIVHVGYLCMHVAVITRAYQAIDLWGRGSGKILNTSLLFWHVQAERIPSLVVSGARLLCRGTPPWCLENMDASIRSHSCLEKLAVSMPEWHRWWLTPLAHGLITALLARSCLSDTLCLRSARLLGSVVSELFVGDLVS